MIPLSFQIRDGGCSGNCDGSSSDGASLLDGQDSPVV
jgi:hypothetical protein